MCRTFKASRPSLALQIAAATPAKGGSDGQSTGQVQLLNNRVQSSRGSCRRDYFVICELRSLLFCASGDSLSQLKRYFSRELKDRSDARNRFFE